MKTSAIWSELPALYRSLLPADVFAEQVPEESDSRCSDCQMCQTPTTPRTPGLRLYNPATRCCTYFPELPNYLVGGILSDPDPALDEGRRRIRAAIARRIGIAPAGISPDKRYKLLHSAANEEHFGQSEALLCPYYKQARCTIWRYREAVCATFLCRPVGGKDGRDFWIAIKRYLLGVQDSLVIHALLELGCDPASSEEPVPGSLGHRDVEGLPPDDTEYSERWGAWVGREEELYRRCYDIVSALTAVDVERIAGVRARALLHAIRARRRDYLQPTLPRSLRRNPKLGVHALGADDCVVGTEAGVFQIPRAAYDLLDQFDGHSEIDEVKRASAAEANTEIDDDFLLALWQRRILVK